MTIWSRLRSFINLFINHSDIKKVEDDTRKITNEIIRHTNLTASPNPFFNFLSEFKAQKQREEMNLSGIIPIKKCKSMAIVKAAGKEWRSMTDKQKEPYREIANKQRKHMLALKKVKKVDKTNQIGNKIVTRQTTQSLCRRCPLLSIPKRKPNKILHKKPNKIAKKRCLKETPTVKIGNVELKYRKLETEKEIMHESNNVGNTNEKIENCDTGKSYVTPMTDFVEKIENCDTGKSHVTPMTDLVEKTDCLNKDSAISLSDTDSDSDVIFIGEYKL